MASRATAGMACAACGGPTRLRFRARGPGGDRRPDDIRCTSDDLGRHDDIWACPACGLAYQHPAPDPDELAAAYADVVDPVYLEQSDRRRAEFRELLGRLEAFREPGRLLEVGSFAGLGLDEAKRRGWAPTGIEPSRWGAAHARSAYGADVTQGTLASAPWPPESFDALAMWDVLEHLPDPLGDLARANRLLVPGGVIALTTVNIAGRSARVLRGRWPWLMRMHLWYFTPRSLELLLAGAGFETLTVEPHPKRLGLGYVLRRAERWAGPAARWAGAVAERTRRAERTVTVDVGDVILAVGRKTRLPRQGTWPN